MIECTLEITYGRTIIVTFYVILKININSTTDLYPKLTTTINLLITRNIDIRLNLDNNISIGSTLGIAIIL